MASKRRLRRRSCQTKRRFGSNEEAQAAVRRRVASSGGKLGGQLLTYRCPFCNGYHIGHPPDRVRQSMASRQNRL
jgi:hypothetical protein